MREIRRRLRELPKDRRKDVLSAIREGRAVRDARDAPLAADWAETLSAKWQRVPAWAMPRSRPTGWRARAWFLHVVWMLAGLAYAVRTVAWPELPGLWHWVIVAFLAYGVLTTPITLRQMLRAYWNAPRAASENRDLIAHTG